MPTEFDVRLINFHKMKYTSQKTCMSQSFPLLSSYSVTHQRKCMSIFLFFKSVGNETDIGCLLFVAFFSARDLADPAK